VTAEHGARPTMPYPERGNSGAAVDINAASAVLRNARYHRDLVVIRYPSGDLTYGQLNDLAARLAAVLNHGGVTSGDRVAHLGLNSAAFLVTLLGTLRIGYAARHLAYRCVVRTDQLPSGTTGGPDGP
jgi:acyl-CoA synthetase (AMP-forming)/AMP-acid ligase II